jgi:hypothetical protein
MIVEDLFFFHIAMNTAKPPNLIIQNIKKEQVSSQRRTY